MTARADLRADCARCFAICCVAPAFARSSDFAVDKPAGVPCPNLADDHRCSIHDRLRPEGFAGCAAYDCFGAGQRLAQETFGGRDWRTHRDVAVPMMAALPILRGLHELLWYVDEALALPSSARISAASTLRPPTCSGPTCAERTCAAPGWAARCTSPGPSWAAPSATAGRRSPSRWSDRRSGPAERCLPFAGARHWG